MLRTFNQGTGHKRKALTPYPPKLKLSPGSLFLSAQKRRDLEDLDRSKRVKKALTVAQPAAPQEKLEWSRPRKPLDRFVSESTDKATKADHEREFPLAFMLVDIVHSEIANDGVANKISRIDPETHPSITEMLMFGVGEGGESYAVHIHGFMHSFDCDSGILLKCPESDWPFWCERVKTRLNECMNKNASQQRRRRGGGSHINMIHKVSVVQRKPFYTHYTQTFPFFHIELVHPGDITLAKNVIWKLGLLRSVEYGACFRTYEPNVEFVIRNMIDTGITGCGWMDFKMPHTNDAQGSDKPIHITETDADSNLLINIRRHINPRFSSYVEKSLADPVSTCDIEIDVYWDQINNLDPEENVRWGRIAPLVVMSYDIEVKAARRGEFPIPEKEGCQIIDIGNLISVYGDKERHKLVTFCLGLSSTPDTPKRDTSKGEIAIPDPEVYCYDTEAEEMVAWASMVQGMGVDITTGYNIYGFDGDYMYSRAEHLGVLSEFAQKTSKLPGRRVSLREAGFANKARGSKKFKIPNTVGNVQFDCLMAVDGDFFLKVRSKKLDNVAGLVLGRYKIDVHHTEINGLHEGTDDTRKKLVEYVNEDAILPLEIIESRAYIPALVEQSRVCHVLLQWMLTKGQQVKSVGSLLPFTKPEGWVLPYIKHDWLTMEQELLERAGDGYTGATVLDPIAGFYLDAVAVLDFSSLYPSIMDRYNLCYSTLLAASSDLRKELIEGVHKIVGPEGHAFLTQDFYRGVMPRALETILAARSKAKKAAAIAKAKYGKNSPEYKREDSRQGALKIVANSLYGFTGAVVGRLPCPPIAETVTAYGRELIERSKSMVEAMDPRYKVVYGDTDSIMVRIVGCQDVGEALKCGREMQKECNSKFQKPINLELENVYYPWLLQGKKMYAGVFWENADAPTYIKSRGLTNVRRDNALFASELFNDMIETLFAWDAKANKGNGAMIEAIKDPETGKIVRHGWDLDTKRMVGDNVTPTINLIRKRREQLYAGDIEMKKLVISQAFSRPLDKYKARLPHTELIRRMRKRDAASAPQLGDRVPYVVLKSHKKARLFERTENPKYAVDHALPIDIKYYDETQCQKPIIRFMAPIFASRLGLDYVSPSLDADEVPEALRETDDFRNEFGEDHRSTSKESGWFDDLRDTADTAVDNIHKNTIDKLMNLKNRKEDPHAVAIRVLFPTVRKRAISGPGIHSPFHAFRKDVDGGGDKKWVSLEKSLAPKQKRRRTKTSNKRKSRYNRLEEVEGLEEEDALDDEMARLMDTCKSLSKRSRRGH